MVNLIVPGHQTYKYAVVLVVLILLISFNSPSKTMEEKSRIGDVQYSILGPREFDKVHDGEWVLLDGRNIDGSDLAKTIGRTVLPDARGVFLRGMNENRNPEQGDAEGNRDVGSSQSDIFKIHHHSISGPATTGDFVSSEANFMNENLRRRNGFVTGDEGGKETRPRNITMYIYIKIK